MPYPTLVSSSFFSSLLVFAVGAFGAVLLGKKSRLINIWSNTSALLGSLLGMMAGLLSLLTHTGLSVSMPSSVPLLAYTIKIDGLSAFFILVISVIGAIASLFAYGYTRHFEGKYNLGTLGFFYNLFLASMLLVVSSGNLLFFLVAWEIMSLASYFLVLYEHNAPGVVHAGTLYFIMTHAGTACLTLAILLLYQATGSFDFSFIREHATQVPEPIMLAIFILTLIGLGTKSGVIPLHIWLPSAHPAAPTHVSALMSGVMIKTGIYMMIRLYMDILPPGPVGWGIIVLGIGAVSSLLGVLYALTEHDIKKLLAYHSIENIGIILLGLGSSMVFLTLGMKELAVLGLTASLFHTMNHATFKALLFFGAGSVISKTHTRNIEEYGGLIKTMPFTALFFLVGSLAISALPPFNGFASEWMTFQTLFAGIRTLDTWLLWAFVGSAGALAFTGGLAAACFVKAFGITFLARPRSDEAKHASEVHPTMLTAMAILSILTLVIGIFAGPISHGIYTAAVVGLSNIGGSYAAFYQDGTTLVVQNGFASLSMPNLFLLIAGIGLVMYAVIDLLTKNRRVRIAETWDCGTTLGPRMEITATGFSRSIITIFKGIVRPTKQITTEYHDADMRYVARSRTITLGISDPYRNRLYRPVSNLILWISHTVKKVQIGPINTYVLYMFVALLALLSALAFL